VGILVTFVPSKVTARRGMSDKPTRCTAATPGPQPPYATSQPAAAAAKHSHNAKPGSQILSLLRKHEKLQMNRSRAGLEK